MQNYNFIVRANECAKGNAPSPLERTRGDVSFRYSPSRDTLVELSISFDLVLYPRVRSSSQACDIFIIFPCVLCRVRWPQTRPRQRFYIGRKEGKKKNHPLKIDKDVDLGIDTKKILETRDIRYTTRNIQNIRSLKLKFRWRKIRLRS